MITVKVLKISYHPSTKNYFILLKDVDSDDCITLTVGSLEAQSIALTLESIEAKRPNTHDLICHLISEIGFSIKRVRITDLKDGVFYSVIDLESKKYGNFNIDSRPSDALAIALRIHAPILVAEEVMKEAIVWEEDSLIIEDEIKQSPEMKVLEKQLQKAIDKEQYEMAARIRDKIKDIDS